MNFERIEEDGFQILSFNGDVDLDSAPNVRAIIMEAIDAGRPLIINMADVRMIDSSGVACLLEGCQKARKKNQGLTLVNVGETVMRVLKLARLETVLPISGSIEDAKKDL